MTFLLLIAAKATLLLAIVTVVELVVRRFTSAAARHALWSATLIALLLLPVLAPVVPRWTVTVPQRAVPHAAAAAARWTFHDDVSVPASAQREASPSFASIALACYLAGVFALLARVVVEQRRIRQLDRRALRLHDPNWNALLRSLTDRDVALLTSDAAPTPMTWGVFAPAVVIPHGADAWPDERRRAVLVHELAHVARRDCLTQTLAASVCALYWPIPLVWWAARRMRFERELACDDRALAQGFGADEYAAHLLEVARHCGSAQHVSQLAICMAGWSRLETRLRAVIDERRVRKATPRSAVALSMLAGLTVLVSVGAVWPVVARTAVVARITRAAHVIPSVARDPGGRAAPEPRPVALRATPPPRPRATLGVTQEQAANVGPIQWTITPSAQGPAVAQLSIGYIGSSGKLGWTRGAIPLARLEGITEGDDVNFNIVRDAGTLACTGTFHDQRGAGDCAFSASAAYAAELERRGIGRPSLQQQFVLAIHDAELDFVRELERQHYERPTIDDLLHAALNGADLTMLRELGAIGYRVDTVARLVSLSNHSVTASYIRDLREAGLQEPTDRELIRLHSNGVTPEMVRQAIASGAEVRE
ncbi:MAG TPA: M56 family metallopeptidase [Thermoanaerobaculia bacterium]|nr:M56 family metallopeptidase [Thermoanaerobaculia bacterium]